MPPLSPSLPFIPLQGWDKTYCLNYLPEEEFDEIHFFGDKTFEVSSINQSVISLM